MWTAFSGDFISQSAHQSLCGRIHVENVAGLVTEADGFIQNIQSGSEHLLEIRKITWPESPEPERLQHPLFAEGDR